MTFTFPPIASHIVEQVARRSGFDYHDGSSELWWTKFTVTLAAAIIIPYLVLLIVILAVFKLPAAIQLALCVPFLGWLFALPCVLAVLISAAFWRYSLRVFTVLFPFLLLVGWDTLGLWWAWEDEESRLHDISFGDELLNWGLYAGQTVWTSGIKYLLCSIAIRLILLLIGSLLWRCHSIMVSLIVPKLKLSDQFRES